MSIYSFISKRVVNIIGKGMQAFTNNIPVAAGNTNTIDNTLA